MSEGMGGGLARRAAWAAAVLAVVLGLSACDGSGSEDNSDQVAAELEALAAATRGIEGAGELLDAGERLARGGGPGQAVDGAGEGVAARAPDVPPGLGAAEEARQEAADALAALATQLEEAAGASERTNVSLSQAREMTAELASEGRGLVRRFAAGLVEALAGYRGEITRLISTLKAAGEVPDEALADAEQALEHLEGAEAAVDRVRRALARRLNRIQASLVEMIERLSGPPALTEATDCGLNADGAQVVVNVAAGAVTCEIALEVSENSSGPNSSTAPPGWQCSLLARTLDGTQIQATAGYGCVSDAGAEISIYDPAAIDSARVGGGSCGDGAPEGLPVFDVEAEAIECQEAFGVIREFVDSGYSEGARLAGGFSCRSTGASGPEGEAFECSSGSDSIRFLTGG